MKVLALLVLLGGLMTTSTGCLSTPAYSASERHAQIMRNWDYEGKQAVDDFDHIMLLRPASHLTIWNVR
jgi:hypothetical protein